MASALVIAYCVINSLIALANAHYCEWALCSSKEYCCGENKCCTNFNTWLLIGCLLLTLLILSVTGACIYRYYCQMPLLRRSTSKSRLILSM